MPIRIRLSNGTSMVAYCTVEEAYEAMHGLSPTNDHPIAFLKGEGEAHDAAVDVTKVISVETE